MLRLASIGRAVVQLSTQYLLVNNRLSKRTYHVSKIKLMIPQSMDSVKHVWIGKIKKNPGDRVKKAELIMNIETGKVDIDELAFIDGTIHEIFVREGEQVPDKTILYSIKPSTQS